MNILAESESPVERARNAMRRVHMDPSFYPTLVMEFAKEICGAELAMIKLVNATLRQRLDGPLDPERQRGSSWDSP